MIEPEVCTLDRQHTPSHQQCNSLHMSPRSTIIHHDSSNRLGSSSTDIAFGAAQQLYPDSSAHVNAERQSLQLLKTNLAEGEYAPASAFSVLALHLLHFLTSLSSRFVFTTRDPSKRSKFIRKAMFFFVAMCQEPPIRYGELTQAVLEITSFEATWGQVRLARSGKASIYARDNGAVSMLAWSRSNQGHCSQHSVTCISASVQAGCSELYR